MEVKKPCGLCLKEITKSNMVKHLKRCKETKALEQPIAQTLDPKPTEQT
jgi:hypothetical protein